MMTFVCVCVCRPWLVLEGKVINAHTLHRLMCVTQPFPFLLLLGDISPSR